MPAEGLLELDDARAAALVPLREGRSHKGTHGTLLCLCGSLDYAGAALLASAAAARAGAGLVAVAVPASLQPVFAGRVWEAITLGLPEGADGDVDTDAAQAAIAARHADAILCGSGWADSEGNARLLTRLLAEPASDPDGPDGGRPAPMVIDGTALNMLARKGEWWTDAARACVLTPHPGEFARLSGRSAGADDRPRAEHAAEFARRTGKIVVLKGARTVVAAPGDRLMVAPFENPGLATAGTGDVLAGTIAALLAQHLPPWDAAALGVYLHGAAGEAVREHLGDAGMLASDLLPQIPLVRARLTRLRERPGGRLGFGARPGP